MFDLNAIKDQIQMLKKVAEMMPPSERKQFGLFMIAMGAEILKLP